MILTKNIETTFNQKCVQSQGVVMRKNNKWKSSALEVVTMWRHFHIEEVMPR